LVTLFLFILTLVYTHYFNNSVKLDGWGTLLMMTGINLGNLEHWKRIIKK